MNLVNVNKLRLSILILIFAILAYFYFPTELVRLVPEYYTPFSRHSAKILLVHNNGFGEREAVGRLQIAAPRLNIDLRVINGNEDNHAKGQLPAYIANIIKVFQPDFVLSLQESLPYYPGAPNYLTLTLGGNNRYLKADATGKVSLANKHLAKFDALLLSIKDTSAIKAAYEAEGKKFYGIAWYTLVYDTDYKPAIPQKLFYSGGHVWDSTRNSEKYRQVFKMLDKTGYFAVCGVKEHWQYIQNSLIGQIPFDGKSIIEAIHKSGASLLLHYKEHLEGGAPTARIFEAAAANAVIISDRHPFVESEFGDNVLYVDVNQDAENLFAQINNHMQWILANPQAAQQLAANCNAIYKQKFLLEDQFKRLLAMHAEFSRR